MIEDSELTFNYCSTGRSGMLFFFLIAFVQLQLSAQQLTVTATNNLSSGRLNQTIGLTSDQLNAFAGIDLKRIHIKDEAGRELIVQAIDTDGDRRSDKIIFQADFGPHQIRSFYLYAGGTHFYQAKDYKTYGRFVRERFDDFAWENDRIGQRVYGPALITTQFGPLISSAIDIWPKRTSKLIINDWYMTDHYHTDSGEGADLYVSGKTRGVGGDGIWDGNKLWVSENFSTSEVRTTGPIRVSFELTYPTFSAGNRQIAERKNVTLDAGQNLNHFTVTYKPEPNAKLQAAAGVQISQLSTDEIRKGLNQFQNDVPIERKPGAIIEKAEDKHLGWLAIRQPVSVGELYSAIIVDPDLFEKTEQDKDNMLVIVNLPSNHIFSYWAGYSWSKSGQFQNFGEWKDYVNNFAKTLRSPIKTEVR